MGGVLREGGRRWHWNEGSFAKGTAPTILASVIRKGELSIVPFMGGGSIYWRLVSS